MKKKRLRLKSWVKVTLAVIVLGGLLGIGLVHYSKSMDEFYRQCDEAKGYTCSYYEARLYSIRGE